MIRRPFTSIFVATAAATVLALIGGTAAQAGVPDPEPSVTSTPTEVPAEDEADKEPTEPVFADYKGRKINLAESWEDATSCTELPRGEVHCYDTDEEAMTDPALPSATRQEIVSAAVEARDPSRCVPDYWCLYQHADYKGKILRFSEDGKKRLKNWGMNNKLSSVFYRVLRWSVNYGDARVIDWRSWPVADRARRLSAGRVGDPSRYPNFKQLDYPGGGNWNDKVDVFEVRRA
ncbi:peptidase inhibitor family I36 protein [Streptomyces silvensis]|uniref:Uncharacterized protein n=1 Tax=Streptomyces silvensis TaxID=1765722 RepID=A0A0W7X0E0_9ACTN|nr:peptidase inhibitor family I36 protein [Streptomyces silvensis]KUF16274.1 hypothetical protein AT728_18245 [Streptomyces silvensis]